MGLDPGSTPGEMADTERAFSSVFGDKAELSGDGVRSLLGASGGQRVTAKVFAAPGGGVTIHSSIKDADGVSVATLNRTFTRDASGTLTAHHDYFVVSESQRGRGVGGALVRNQLDQYEKIGVGNIEMVAAWDGRYVWPKMGFEVQEFEKPLLNRRWQSYLTRNKLPSHPISGVQDIVAHPGGKAFLLGSRAPMLSLSATPTTLKAKLDAKRKATP